MDRFGVKATFIVNVALVIPCLFLSLYLWREKDKSDDERGSAGHENNELTPLREISEGARLPSVSDLLAKSTEGHDVVEGGDIGITSAQLRQVGNQDESQSEGDKKGRVTQSRAEPSVGDDLPFFIKLRRIFSRTEWVIDLKLCIQIPRCCCSNLLNRNELYCPGP